MQRFQNKSGLLVKPQGSAIIAKGVVHLAGTEDICLALKGGSIGHRGLPVTWLKIRHALAQIHGIAGRSDRLFRLPRIWGRVPFRL